MALNSPFKRAVLAHVARRWQGAHAFARLVDTSLAEPRVRARNFAASAERDLVVAAAQLQPRTLPENLCKILHFIEDAAQKGVEVLLFPEAAIPGYDDHLVLQATREELHDAELKIRHACAANHIAVIVGTAHYDAAGDCFNSATLINPHGDVIGRQHKLQLVPTDENWSCPGRSCQVFNLLGVPMAVLICHDKRYPELARLPVLAGARIIFYMACESWHDDLPLPHPRVPPWSHARLESELAVYRAQMQARAVENRVWVVKANVSGCKDEPGKGSHGMSSVIDPTGIVQAEAGIFTEELIWRCIDLREATALYATKSVRNAYPLAEMWQEALKHVVVH